MSCIVSVAFSSLQECALLCGRDGGERGEWGSGGALQVFWPLPGPALGLNPLERAPSFPLSWCLLFLLLRILPMETHSVCNFSNWG